MLYPCILITCRLSLEIIGKLALLEKILLFMSISVSLLSFPTHRYISLSTRPVVFKVNLFFFPYSQLEDINVPLWHNKHVQGSYHNHKASNWLYLKVRNNRQEQMSIDFISMQMFFIINKGRELHKMWCICPKVTLNGMIFWSFSCVIGGSLQYKSLTINSVYGI